MTKRKEATLTNNNKTHHQNHHNPLAHARGKQNAPANIWFRRSGAGVRLFVDYYSNQPVGVVIPAVLIPSASSSSAPNEEKNEEQEENGCGSHAASTGATNPTPTRGMSRAAKRRRKRNKGEAFNTCNSDNNNENNNPLCMEAHPQTATTTASPVSMTSAAPLLKAAHSLHTKDLLLPFLRAMSRPLPTTFRIRHTAIPSQEDRLRQSLQQEFQSSGVVVAPIAIQSSLSSPSLPLLFQCTLAKSQLSEKAPQLKELLLEYSQNGTIARQELGSMLPVLVLGRYIRPGDCIVDMCASPGSKTLQALEQVVEVAAVSEQGNKNNNKFKTKGLVLANDVLGSRLDALRAAVLRSGVPSDYTQRIRYSQVDATKLSLSSLCDAVICDVPCSGDGTCRKDPHILPMWKPQAGNSLHTTQLAILKRSLEIVKLGGVVCYSTCSLNPVEDEAVVAAAMGSFPTGTVELMDLTDGLDGWKHRPGVSTWKVAHYIQDDADDRIGMRDDNEGDEIPGLTWYETYDDAKAAGNMKEAVPSMWPLTNAAVAPLHLERCVRLLPQDYDSGGFFLALLKKCKR